MDPVTKKLLKKLLCMHCSHSKVYNHGLKKKVENADVNVGKRKTRFPNVHVKKKILTCFLASFFICIYFKTKAKYT